MAVDTKTLAHNVVEGMSTLITHSMASATYHAWNPSHSADDDDAKMKRYKERVTKLRELRTQFEDLMFGEIDD